DASSGPDPRRRGSRRRRRASPGGRARGGRRTGIGGWAWPGQRSRRRRSAQAPIRQPGVGSTGQGRREAEGRRAEGLSLTYAAESRWPSAVLAVVVVPLVPRAGADVRLFEEPGEDRRWQ